SPPGPGAALSPNRKNTAALAAMSTATPLPGPTEPPTATIPPTATPDFSGDIGQIYNVIDQVESLRGANSILRQYWEEAQANGGETGGCRQATPTIPSNYVLDQTAGPAPDALVQAVNSVNTGLQALRDNWAEFGNACAAGSANVFTSASTGVTVANTTTAAFEAADLFLQQARGQAPGQVENAATQSFVATATAEAGG
ncbi:MAG: hypothetical protein AAF125_12665, partial [Chloroflexota bacterium]